jgi:hypothetical protein
MEDIATLGSMGIASREQVLLQNFMSKDPEVNKAVKEGDVLDLTLKHRAKITSSSGIVNLLKSGNDKRDGVSDFENQNLEEGLFLVLTRIGFKWGSTEVDDTTDEAPSKIGYVSTQQDVNDKDIPNTLLNANLVLLRNGKRVFQMAVSEFVTMQEYAGNNVKKEDFKVFINQVKKLAPKDKIELQLHMPENTTFPATTPATYYYVEVSIGGLGTARSV